MSDTKTIAENLAEQYANFISSQDRYGFLNEAKAKTYSQTGFENVKKTGYKVPIQPGTNMFAKNDMYADEGTHDTTTFVGKVGNKYIHSSGHVIGESPERTAALVKLHNDGTNQSLDQHNQKTIKHFTNAIIAHLGEHLDDY